MFSKACKSTVLPILLALTLSSAGAMLNGAYAAASGDKSTPVENSALPTPVTPAVTPAQARHTLSILQDEKKRAELEQTLGAIARATEAVYASRIPRAACTGCTRLYRNTRRMRQHPSKRPLN